MMTGSDEQGSVVQLVIGFVSPAAPAAVARQAMSAAIRQSPPDTLQLVEAAQHHENTPYSTDTAASVAECEFPLHLGLVSLNPFPPPLLLLILVSS